MKKNDNRMTEFDEFELLSAGSNFNQQFKCFLDHEL